MTLFNAPEEQRQHEEWVCADESQPIDYVLIANKVVDGFEMCEEHCSSRNICGVDGCYCLRANFPTPRHYEIYKQVKADTSQVIAFQILAKALDNQKE